MDTIVNVFNNKKMFKISYRHSTRRHCNIQRWRNSPEKQNIYNKTLTTSVIQRLIYILDEVDNTYDPEIVYIFDELDNTYDTERVTFKRSNNFMKHLSSWKEETCCLQYQY